MTQGIKQRLKGLLCSGVKLQITESQSGDFKIKTERFDSQMGFCEGEALYGDDQLEEECHYLSLYNWLQPVWDLKWQLPSVVPAEHDTSAATKTLSKRLTCTSFRDLIEILSSKKKEQPFTVIAGRCFLIVVLFILCFDVTDLHKNTNLHFLVL